MTKQKILDSAIKIMANHSFSNTTVRMIADEAGVSVGSIYNHYQSKEDILNCLFNEEFLKRKQQFIFLNKNEFSSVEKLLAFVEFHFRELKLNENLAKVLIRESTNPDLAELESVQKFNKELPKEFYNILQYAVNHKEIRAVDPFFVSHIIFNLIRCSIYTIAFQDFGSIEQMKNEVKNFIEKALRKEDK